MRKAGLGIAALAIAVCFASDRTRTAADEPTQKNAPAPTRTDLYGDPLPAGAIARMGTVRFRYGGAAVLSPDGKIVARSSYFGESFVQLWDVETGKELAKFHWKEGYYVGTIIFSSDSRTLLALGVNWALNRALGVQNRVELKFLDVATGKELRQLVLENFQLHLAAVSPDGKLLASLDPNQTIHLLDLTTGKELIKFRGHRYNINAIAFSPDGRMLATGSDDKTVRLWDVGTGKEITKLRGHTKPVACLAFSSDGKVLASGSQDYSVRIWDLATRKEKFKLEGNKSPVTSLAISPDGKILATGCRNEPTYNRWNPTESPREGSVRLWDITTGKEILKISGHDQGVSVIAFSSDGKTLTTLGASDMNRSYSGHYGDPMLRRWEVATGNELTKHEGHQRQITALAFSPDGKMLLSRSNDKTVRVWDVNTSKELSKFVEPEEAGAYAAFSPNGKILALAGADNAVHLLETTNGKEVHKIQVKEGTVNGLVFSPDGKVLASLSGRQQQETNLIQLWEVETGNRLKILPAQSDPNGIASIAFSPDGKMMASAARYNSPIQVMDVASGKLLLSIGGTEQYYEPSVFFSPDGKILVVCSRQGGGGFALLEVATGKELLKLNVYPSYGGPPPTFLSDGKTLAVLTQNVFIQFWHIGTGMNLSKHRQDYANSDAVSALAISPDGKLLATGMADTTILIWSLSDLQEKVELPTSKLSPTEVEELWAELIGEDVPLIYEAMWTLSSSGPKAIAFLKDHLKCEVTKEPERIQKFIAMLDDNDYAIRDLAHKELKKIITQAEPMLRKTLETTSSAEVKDQITKLLEPINLPLPLKPGEPLRRLRAIQVLEWNGSLEAREILETLAKESPSVREAQDGQAALERLSKHLGR